jgi:hypothetical protein
MRRKTPYLCWLPSTACVALLCAGTAPGSTLQQPAPDGATADAAREASELEGLWPSRKLIRLMVRRWSEEVIEEYELDDDQGARYNDLAVKRWSEYLDGNRRRIQPLINEFIEMRMELEPPSKEQVQEWAERALPVFTGFREQINGGLDDFRSVLNPLQKAKFETKALEFGVGMDAAETKLKQWERGDFDPQEFWEPTESERRRRRAERRAAEAEEAKTQPADQVEQELARWEEYVVVFSRLHRLDEAQKVTARSMLRELTKRARDYRDRNREHIATLERRIADHSGSEEKLTEIKAQLVTVYGPIDEMFTELKSRLDSLPTDQQRQWAKAGEAPAAEETPAPSADAKPVDPASTGNPPPR